jgi:hypothetical protein
MLEEQKSICHILKLMHLSIWQYKAASLPVVALVTAFHSARDVEKLTFVFGPRRWSAIFWRLLRIDQFPSRFMLLRGPLSTVFYTF